MTKVYIYALHHPDTDEVFYIGKTENLTDRMQQHRHTKSMKDAKSKWIASLTAEGKSPTMSVIEECAPDTWQQAERKWIAHYRAINPLLVNTSDGGYGRKQSRFPERLSIVKITKEMRARLNMELKKDSSSSEAVIVRSALEKYLSRYEDTGKL